MLKLGLPQTDAARDIFIIRQQKVKNKNQQRNDKWQQQEEY